MTSTTFRSVLDLETNSSPEFAEGLIIAHPQLDLVEVAYSWCTPDQVRGLVDAVRHVRRHPYSGEDREIAMMVCGFTLESPCAGGYIYIDDTPFSSHQAEYLETEAMRAVIAVEADGTEPGRL